MAKKIGAIARPEEVVFAADYKVYDGRFANNAWLQELPDPLTKLTWDNAALISPETAKGLKVTEGDVLTITVTQWHFSRITSRQMVDIDLTVRKQHAQAFDQVRELTDVARPVVVL